MARYRKKEDSTWIRTDGDDVNIYDGEERVIGEWFGKPLYRKLFDLGSDKTIPTTTWYDTNIDISYVNMLIQGFGIYSNGTSMTYLLPNKNLDKLRLQTLRNAESYCRYIVLEYTKTTD